MKVTKKDATQHGGHWTEFFMLNRTGKLQRKKSDRRRPPPWVKSGHIAGLLADIRRGVVGKDAAFNGPFGKVRVVYCDYTASGKPLQFIEDFIRDYVFPFYANTHTTTNVSGRQTSEFRKEAKLIIRTCVNATDEDAVIFTGSGTTAAIHKILYVLQLHDKEVAKRTVVLNGPYEHHSNILPWKECGAICERIGQDSRGLVDMQNLEEKLQYYQANDYKIIVAMSAASNVTGIITDTEKVAELSHKYGALSLWDYAAGGPYLEIDMNPPGLLTYKDAVYLSPHKFVGGVGTPGLLIAKKRLFTNAVPHGVGGGTVSYVTKVTHAYVKDIEEREEGGTPAIVESIRAGLAFSIKRALGEDTIEAMEGYYTRLAFNYWAKNPNIIILGSPTANRVPIFSMLIYNPQTGRLLHHNFVCSLLNDLFGIQARGGCACAGPYAIDLLGMRDRELDQLVHFLTERKNCDSPTCQSEDHSTPMSIMKFGFSRLNLPYFFDEDTVNYVLRAVDMVATHGWKLLPLYTYNTYSSDWHHRDQGDVTINTLLDLRFEGGNPVMGRSALMREQKCVTIKHVEKNAKAIIAKAEKLGQKPDTSRDPELHIDSEQRRELWFAVPEEVQPLLYLPKDHVPYYPISRSVLPFKPPKYDDACDETPGSSRSSTESYGGIGKAGMKLALASGAVRVPGTSNERPVEKVHEKLKHADQSKEEHGIVKQNEPNHPVDVSFDSTDSGVDSESVVKSATGIEYAGSALSVSIDNDSADEATDTVEEAVRAKDVFSWEDSLERQGSVLVSSFLRHAQLSVRRQTEPEVHVSVRRETEPDIQIPAAHLKISRQISISADNLNLPSLETGLQPGIRCNLTSCSNGSCYPYEDGVSQLEVPSTKMLSLSAQDLRRVGGTKETKTKAGRKRGPNVCTIS